ncbi:MAG: peroxisomal membrane protein pex14 [Phylliscum demangeonii]|nr:MAG: peroxisomal membrane protein pex14 [Phylliscum demangeonii]
MIREAFVASAISFLQNPGVSTSPLEKQLAFLQSKNLTKEEISVALARASDRTSPATSTSASPPAQYASEDGYQGGRRQRPPYRDYEEYPEGYGSLLPPPLPRRDWRDWFIMATMMGGMSYGLYVIVKRYIYPLIAPPTPPKLEQDKQAIDEQFSRAFALLEQVNIDTEALKAAEQTRTERLDSTLREVETMVIDLKQAGRRREDEARRISDDVRVLKDLVPRAMEAHKDSTEARLKELNTELKSLKTLVGNRMNAGSKISPPAGAVGGAANALEMNGKAVPSTTLVPDERYGSDDGDRGLPYEALPLRKDELAAYRALFALYLEVHKQLVLEELPRDEVRGRWKSFVGRWNRGELAEGWYDPSMKSKAEESTAYRLDERSREGFERGQQGSSTDGDPSAPHDRGGARDDAGGRGHRSEDDNDDDDDDDENDDGYGPSLPRESEFHPGRSGSGAGAGGDRDRATTGPAIPSMQDLDFRRELAADELAVSRDSLRHARKLDRVQRQERLEELVPRADAGTHERRLEKKRELNDSRRAFRAAKSPGAADEVGERELMDSGDDDGLSAFKAKKKEGGRKKNDREVRKEEMLRTRAAEREEKLREHRAKEDKTLAMLKALAKQNFG